MYLADLVHFVDVPVTTLVLEIIDNERVVGERGQFVKQLAERLNVHEGAVRSALSTLYFKRRIKKIYIGSYLVGIERFNHKDRTPDQMAERRNLHVEGAVWRFA